MAGSLQTVQRERFHQLLFIAVLIGFFFLTAVSEIGLLGLIIGGLLMIVGGIRIEFRYFFCYHDNSVMFGEKKDNQTRRIGTAVG